VTTSDVFYMNMKSKILISYSGAFIDI